MLPDKSGIPKHLSCLQEPYCVECLLNVRKLVFEACNSSLIIGFHELVFAIVGRVSRKFN